MPLPRPLRRFAKAELQRPVEWAHEQGQASPESCTLACLNASEASNRRSKRTPLLIHHITRRIRRNPPPRSPNPALLRRHAPSTLPNAIDSRRPPARRRGPRVRLADTVHLFQPQRDVVSLRIVWSTAAPSRLSLPRRLPHSLPRVRTCNATAPPPFQRPAADGSYYDNANFPYHPACDAAAGGPGWAQPTNEGSTACGASVKDLNTNAVVAMNVTWLNQNGYAARLDELCGRE